ncbi:MAG TPA: type II toxin-antitoxin system VapC family toxin [Thermoanaerobaculia bacterium]|nr:type II toxin-antitoxin system VapC family toxin [Thermoanaerobaculia bacterium]
MILYLDTSSLVKLYLEEEHSDLVREWVESAEAVATSRVAYPEALSAFARRRQADDVSAEDFELLRQACETDWPSFVLLPLGERRAGGLAVKHVLRGFDAVHLSAALDLVEQLAAESIVFSAFDAKLLDAARAEGIASLLPAGE